MSTDDSTQNVLVIAFDGLDYELIQEFDLKHVLQQEHGSIDNDTGVSTRKTGELFTSFITGETYAVHSVTGVDAWRGEPKPLRQFEELVEDSKLFGKFRGMRKAIYESINSWSLRLDWPIRDDILVPTLFDQIDNSRALFVPGYNTSTFFRCSADTRPLLVGLGLEETINHYDTREHRHRREKLFRPVNTYYDFCMVHFHRPDLHQHLYGEKDAHYDHDRLRELYEETDELAKKILDYFEDGFDAIILMSDHGLPEDHQHNKRAFYSCNQELFGWRQPHITDFHDKILELVQEAD